MKEFIKTQYKLYSFGAKCIGVEKIKKLAEKFMTEEEIADLFKDGEADAVK